MLQNDSISGGFTHFCESKCFHVVIKVVQCPECHYINAQMSRAGVYLCILPSHGQPYNSTRMQTVAESLVIGSSLM